MGLNMKTYEILFTDGNVSVENWTQLIEKISIYHGAFHSWKLVLQIIENEIHFFIQTKYALHPVMNGLTFFCFQEQNFFVDKKYQSVFSTIIWSSKTFLDFYDQWLLKKQKQINWVEFQFYVGLKGKIRHRSYFYYEKNSFFCKSKLYLFSITSFLSFDYSKTNRFVLKKIPKYFNVQKYLNLFQKEKTDALFQISTFPYQEQDSFFSLKQYDFFKHSLILGGSGTGKSKFLSSMVAQIAMDKELNEQYKVIMMDPHASIEQEIGGLSGTTVVDFLEPNTSIDLFANDFDDIITEVELYLSMFQTMMNDVYNSKLERVLRFSLELLFQIEEFSFSSLRNLLLDTNKRTEFVQMAREKKLERVVTFFLQDFYDVKTQYYEDTIAPIIAFLDEMQSLPVFQNEQNSPSLKKIISENFFTLISFDRSKLGSRITKTIAGFLMGQLFQIIHNSNFFQHLIFIVDEVAVLENPILCRFLSESRKYHVSVILVSQYFNQISNDLKNAILANVENYYLFRISFLDAEIFAKNLNMSISKVNTLEEHTKILTELNHREGVFRLQKDGKFLPSMKIKTLDFQAIPYQRRKKNGNHQILHESKKNYFFEFGENYSLKKFLKTISTSHKKVRDFYE